MHPHSTAARPQRLASWLIALAALALTGCATVMRVDSQVQSHAKWPSTDLPARDSSYEFERLPSQTTGPADTAQAMIEAQAREALAALGWHVTATGNAPWRVTVSAQTVTLPRAPWDEPRGGGWLFQPRLGVGMGTGRGGLQWGGMLSMDMPYYQRSVSLVVRDGQTGRVAYETRAAHDGRWHDSPAVWRAMIDAALRDFPAPPAGTRTVNIDIPR